MTDKEKIKKLRDLALKYLRAYHSSEGKAIWEYSCAISEDEKELDEECKQAKEEIERIFNEI